MKKYTIIVLMISILFILLGCVNQEKYDNLETENVSLNNEITELKNKIEELENDKTEIENERDELEDNLSEANSNIEEANSNIEVANEKIQDVKYNIGGDYKDLNDSADNLRQLNEVDTID